MKTKTDITKKKIAFKFNQVRCNSEELQNQINNYFNNAETYFEGEEGIIIGTYFISLFLL